MQHMQHSKENGFTITELVLVMVIIAMVVGVFGQMLVSSNQSASISRARVDINRTLHNSMDAIETDVRQAVRFKASGYDGYDTFAVDRSFSGTGHSWSYMHTPYVNGTNRVLILLQYATTMGHGADSRQIVYLRTPVGDCAAKKTQQPKYKKIIIYFLNNGELHRRTIYNDMIDPYGHPYSGSAGNYFCMNHAEANKFKDRAMKVHQDSILATGVSEFEVEYYEGKTKILDQYDAVKSYPGILDSADNVVVTLKLQSPSKQISESQTLTIRKINNL